MLSKLAKISNATRAGFILAAVSLLSGCKSDDIAACVKQETGLNDEIEIHNNGIAMEFFYADKTYYEYYVFTEKPGLDTYIETGIRLTERQGKRNVVLHYDKDHWYDSGTAEPQRSIIKAIKKCSAQTLPERAANLN